MSSFTFETLPDEILMIIFQYSGNIFNILQTFLGLNQHLNNILLDKRLHLLTNFLYINVRNDYYDSHIFQQVSQQLLSINTTIDEEKLSHILQPLISFHIQQKYIELGHEIQQSLAKLTSTRQQFTNDELVKVDHELKTQFDNLRNAPITREIIQRIKSLVSIRGGRLVCDDNELTRSNLAQAINEQFLSCITKTQSNTSISINSFLQLFKILIISNISLLKNRDYVGNGGCTVDYFLLYTLYRLRYFYGNFDSLPVNMECYRATVDLFLFALQCHKQTSENDEYIQQNMFDILTMSSKMHNNLFIRTVQVEILKIVVEEYLMKTHEPWRDYTKDRFLEIFKELIANKRIDIIKYIYSHVQLQQYFNEPKYIREWVNIMTRNQSGRRFFSMIIDDRSLDLLFPKKHLIFILLDKKERKLLEKLLKISPCLIHQLDEEGNDPLLYICLKVNGCRHRIIEVLIKTGCDIERRNFKGQNFLEILQLQRNERLFQNLTELEIIKTDVL